MYKLAPHEASCLAEHSATVRQDLAPHPGGTGHRPLVQRAEPRSHPRAAFSAARMFDIFQPPALSQKNCLSGGTVTDRDQLLTHRDAKAEMLLLTLNCFGTQHDTSPQLRHDHFQEFRQTKCV